MAVKNETRGGKRPGSGRPKKAPTTTIAFRVPVKLKDKLKTAILKLIHENYL